jgi:arginine deiminase
MVHRPGLEHTRLTPSNAEELLFDDVIWVARAKAEHDMFVEVMRDRGVEVFLAEQLLAEALAKPEAKDWVRSHILSERQVGITGSRRAHEWVETAEPATVAEFLIGGITKADVREDAGLQWKSADPSTLLLPPLPNFLFQRDCSCWIFGGVTINPMTKPARKRCLWRRSTGSIRCSRPKSSRSGWAEWMRTGAAAMSKAGTCSRSATAR